jgi:phospholipid N-methyltransferase
MDLMTDTRLFLAEACREFRTTGAIAPSSRWLAAALAEPVRRAAPPLGVLEVGAGTGPVTRRLLRLLGPESTFDVVEVNPRFAARLRILVGERAQVHETRAETLDTGRTYDMIISGLPFTNFEPAVVQAIMDRYLDLLRPGGTLTYFAYVGTARARRLLSSPAEAHRHRDVEELLAAYHRKYGVKRRLVPGNLPPARVWQLRG